MEFEIRAIGEDEVQLFRTKLSRGFGADLSDKDEDGSERFKAIAPLARTRAAFAGTEMIGTLACFPFTLTVPGGSVAMGGTTMITVQATHRRRGALRAMMLDHLEDVRAAGEPVAGLWASEGSIYGRFGFATASQRHEIELDAGVIHFTEQDTEGDIRLIEADEAAKVLPGVYEKVQRSRPGMLSRAAPYWKWSVLYDPEPRREGKSAWRFAVHRGGDGDDGYVMYRQKEKWEGFLSRGKVAVGELIAITPAAHDGLWKYLTNIDLFPQVAFWNQPVDDELAWRITDPRRVARKVWDGLWLRMLDVPTALAARSYSVDGSIRIGVTDDLYPDNNGTYEIVSASGESECRKVDGDADLFMKVEALGAIYLGGQRLGTMARARRVHGSADAIRRADGFFGWDPAPWCADLF